MFFTIFLGRSTEIIAFPLSTIFNLLDPCFLPESRAKMVPSPGIDRVKTSFQNLNQKNCKHNAFFFSISKIYNKIKFHHILTSFIVFWEIRENVDNGSIFLEHLWLTFLKLLIVFRVISSLHMVFIYTG